MLADTGSSVAISPDVELKTGFGRPMTGQGLAAGLRPTLSVDDVPSAGGDLFSTLRTAFAVRNRRPVTRRAGSGPDARRPDG